ncbi:MAG: hypothetical protein R3D25_05900 [Geminicoccaceae bacterium]
MPDIAGRAAGDLADQRQAEAPAAGVLAVALRPVEGLEDLLRLARWHARAMVANGEPRAAVGRGPDCDLDRGAPVSYRVLQGYSHQPAQEPLLAHNGDRRPSTAGA